MILLDLHPKFASMKALLLFLGLLLLSSQVDYYDIDWNNSSISIEMEENNSLVEEYVLKNKFQLKEPELMLLETNKIYCHQLLFYPLHLEKEIDPPELLS